jgi:hypothetical protein
MTYKEDMNFKTASLIEKNGLKFMSSLYVILFYNLFVTI